MIGSSMDLGRLLRLLRRWWWLGLIPVLIVSGYLAITTQPVVTAYQVVLRFTTGGEPASTLSPDHDRYYAWLSSEYIANALADLAVTSGFSQAVSERLTAQNINIAPQAIQGAIVTDHAQSVLVIYITWSDPDQAVALAQTVGDLLLEQGPNYYPQMDRIGKVAKLADIPVAVALPASLRAQLLVPAVRLFIATVAGVGLILFAHLADPRLREPAELEEIGLPLLATIPRLKRPPRRRQVL